MPASHRPNGRVTPKGVRPAGANAGQRPADRAGATFSRSAARSTRPLPDRRSAVRAAVVRTGHRGGR